MDALIELLNFVRVDQSEESVALRGDIEVQMKHSELPLVFDSDYILGVKKRMAELKRVNFELFESTQPLLNSARKPTFGFGRFVPPAGATAAPSGICHPSPEWGAQFALRAIEELRQKKADDEEKQLAGLQDKPVYAIQVEQVNHPPQMLHDLTEHLQAVRQEEVELERVKNELRERMRKNKDAWYLEQPEPRVLDNPGPTCCSIPSCIESNVDGSYYCAGHAADPRSPPSSPELKPTEPPTTAMAAMTLTEPTIRKRLATVLKERGFTAYPDLNAEWLQEMDSVIALASKSVTLTPDHIIRMAENALDAQLARIRTPKVEPMD